MHGLKSSAGFGKTARGSIIPHCCIFIRMYIAASPSIVVLSSLLASVLSVGGFLYCAGSFSAHLYLFSVLVSVGIGTSLLKFTEIMDNFYHIKSGERLINEVLSAPEL